MKVLAMSLGAESFAIQTSENAVRILDRRSRRLFPSDDLAAVLSRAGWVDFHGDESPILAMVESILAHEPD